MYLEINVGIDMILAYWQCLASCEIRICIHVFKLFNIFLSIGKLGKS